MAKKPPQFHLLTDIEFRTEKRKLGDLVPYERNPRTLSKKQYEDLMESFRRFNYVELCVVNEDNTVVAGHQRLKIMMDLWGKDKEIEVRVPNRVLTHEEFREYLMRSNSNTGSFDLDIIMADYDLDFLNMIGFDKSILGIEEEIEDISEVADINESANFTIKCKNIVELKKLQDYLGTQKNKVTLEKFMELIEDLN